MAEKKKAKVTAVRSSTTAKSAKEAAYGKKEYTYEKAQKPKKDLNSSDYQGLTKAQRNTKYYGSEYDSKTGNMAATLKSVGKAKEKNLSNKEARAMYEGANPKAKGKDFSKVKVTNVNEEAYKRVIKRAKDSGLSAADAKKAIESAIRTTSAGLKSDRDKVAMRFKMQETKKKIAAQNKIKRGY